MQTINKTLLFLLINRKWVISTLEPIRLFFIWLVNICVCDSSPRQRVCFDCLQIDAGVDFLGDDGEKPRPLIKRSVVVTETKQRQEQIHKKKNKNKKPKADCWHEHRQGNRVDGASGSAPQAPPLLFLNRWFWHKRHHRRERVGADWWDCRPTFGFCRKI